MAGKALVPALLGEVLGADVLDELAELLDLLLFLLAFLFLVEEHSGLVEDRLVGEDRHLGAVAMASEGRLSMVERSPDRSRASLA